MPYPPHRALLLHALLMLHLVLAAAGCSKPEEPVVELARFPLDSQAHILDHSAVFDPALSVDGRGSARFEARGVRSVRLAEMALSDVDDVTLTYTARLRSEGLQGRAYLEMWCVFPGLGEFFSRNAADAITGTTDWTFRQTPFFLRKGERPAAVKLNLVLDGKGTVWIDDLRILKGPLPE